MCLDMHDIQYDNTNSWLFIIIIVVPESPNVTSISLSYENGYLTALNITFTEVVSIYVTLHDKSRHTCADNQFWVKVTIVN